MQTTWTIPGTTLEADRSDADRTGELFRSMFLAGGLTLSQVSSISGLEPYTVQNWVKRKFLAPPQGKRYNMEQLCRILTINTLRAALSLDQICGLIRYINGDLADESDDIIDDTQLYQYFISLAARARHIGGTKEWGEAIDEVLSGYAEPFPGTRQKVAQVLRIMLTAWITAQLQGQIQGMLGELS